MKIEEERKTSYSLRQTLEAALYDHLQQGHSVSLWKQPPSSTIYLLVSFGGPKEIQTLEVESSAPGFAISPFNPSAFKLFLQGDVIYEFQENSFEVKGTSLELASQRIDAFLQSNDAPKPLPFHPSTRGGHYDSSYVDVVKAGIERIEAGLLEKIVPARSEQVNFPASQDWLSIYFKLIERYPLALVSLVSTPATGTWMGATPELLISLNAQQVFKTVALAGTKPFIPGMDLRTVAWTEKEIEEQAMVSRYIINCFKKIRVREFEEHGPRTSQAGNLLHLKTEFTVNTSEINFQQLASVMLNLLHPTSAVCGMPLSEALSFLQNHEGFDRELYSGYWGPVNINNETNLYVNLRCMKIQDQSATLFAGAGVTIESKPEDEWQETVWKMNTLLNVITS